MKEDDLIPTGAILIVFIIIVITSMFVIGIHNMIIDYKCTKMSDNEFFNSEKCKPYWSYRRNK